MCCSIRKRVLVPTACWKHFLPKEKLHFPPLHLPAPPPEPGRLRRTLVNIGNTSGTAATDITFDNVQIDAGLPAGAAAPLINSLTPNSGHPGDTIVIAGLNFGASQNGSTSVKFGATTASYPISSAGSIPRSA